MTSTHFTANTVIRSSLLRRSASMLVGGAITLAISLLINPGPDIAHVHDNTWVTGHLLNGAAYALLLLGVPAVAVALGSRLGWLGTFGIAALMIRLATSTGSQLYYARISPRLADIPAVHGQLGRDGMLADVYGGWSDATSALLGLGMLGLVYALWRAGTNLRVISVVLGLGTVAEIVGITPVELIAWTLVWCWLGLRLLRSSDVQVPLRAHRKLVTPATP